MAGTKRRAPHEVRTPAWRQAVRRRLRAWYDRTARDLPWRRSRDPYAVWVSEIMLQQTQVATVEPYFERFLATFPTIDSLAAADEEEVLRLWEGLGYYRRARQLHAASRVVVREHGARFPREPDAVRELPGIGRYTAGAILSIAFDAREPILEANSTRLLARLVAEADDPARTATRRKLWEVAAELLPRAGVGDFNQALMELGSEVCTPREPACDRCPLTTLCAARAAGRQEEIPPPKRRPKLTDVREAAVVVRRRGRVLLVRCAAGERWAGLWDFPRFRLPARRGDARVRALVDGVRARAGVDVEPLKQLTTIRHGVTRYRITLECHAARYVSASRGGGSAEEIRWFRPAELAELPLNTTGRRLVRLLVEDGVA